jgi:hypothetical protein
MRIIRVLSSIHEACMSRAFIVAKLVNLILVKASLRWKCYCILCVRWQHQWLRLQSIFNICLVESYVSNSHVLSRFINSLERYLSVMLVAATLISSDGEYNTWRN